MNAKYIPVVYFEGKALWAVMALGGLYFNPGIPIHQGYGAGVLF